MKKIALAILLASLAFGETEAVDGKTVLDEEGQVQAIISKDVDGYSVECGKGYIYVGSGEAFENIDDATESVTSDCEPKEE